MIIQADEIPDIDLSDLFPYVVWHENCKYFDKPKEHYKLLSYISKHLQKGPVIDVGTYLGFSALALSHNENIQVITYNLQDDIPDEVVSAKARKNIEFRYKNCLEDIAEIMLAPVIFLDTNHDGFFEREFIGALEKEKYKGLVFCDDIHLNNEMRSFWKDVQQPKMDITHIGHWSGTGVIIFDDTFEIL